jgi:hypothetical protein
MPNESPAGPSGTAQRATKKVWYYAFQLTKSKEVCQESAIFQRMQAGLDDERLYSIGHDGPFSIPEMSSNLSVRGESPTTATTSLPVVVKAVKAKGTTFVTCDEDDGPVAHVPDPRLFASRASTLPCRMDSDGAYHPQLYHPVPSKPNPEDFYRSSPDYRAGIREDQSTVTDQRGSNRPRTPYPNLGNASRRKFATIPPPSSQRLSILSEPRSLRGHEAAAIRRQGVHQELRQKAFPPRLPSNYRPPTPFSFERPPTTTPFVGRPGGQSVTLPARLRNAPRCIDGVDLELRSSEDATRTRPRRTAWPEQRLVVRDDGRVGDIPGEGGIPGEEDIPGEGDIPGVDVQEAGTKKKGKFAWLKKLFKRKDAPSTFNRDAAQGNT